MKRARLIQIIKEETIRVLNEQDRDVQIPGALEGVTVNYVHSQLKQIQQGLDIEDPLFEEVAALIKALAPEERAPEERVPDEENALRNADGTISKYGQRSTSPDKHFRKSGDTRYANPGGADGNAALNRDR